MHDDTTLLGLTNGYTVRELRIGPRSWMAHRRLDELDLPEEGVTLLALRRANGEFIGAPRHDIELHPRDTLILYGRAEPLSEIGTRQSGSAGDKAHLNAVDAHRRGALDQVRRDHPREAH
ncbi:MAG TPA: TrkA C-terminal domain-containing protein [Ktedonobacterales bacterium]|nr:TrkA C-terminal domain-containing protein [Ktedonobacterales bacterium]